MLEYGVCYLDQNGNLTYEFCATYVNDKRVMGCPCDEATGLQIFPAPPWCPREAFSMGPDGQYAYVVSPEKRHTEANQDFFDDGTDAASQGDVKPGDRVIVDGQLHVLPGATVVPEGSKPAPVATGGAKGKGSGKNAEAVRDNFHEHHA